MAAVALLIVVVLVALGVHSCQVSQRNNALKDYTNNVSSLIQQSDTTGTGLFDVLSTGASSGTATTVQNEINQTRVKAVNQLDQVRGLSVPDQVKSANQNLVLAFQMRVDGITNIANQIQPALGTSTSKQAINTIAAEMARLYASDVVYKDYTAPAIAGHIEQTAWTRLENSAHPPLPSRSLALPLAPSSAERWPPDDSPQTPIRLVSR